jgi:hypothetical protein
LLAAGEGIREAVDLEDRGHKLLRDEISQQLYVMRGMRYVNRAAGARYSTRVEHHAALCVVLCSSKSVQYVSYLVC